MLRKLLFTGPCLVVLALAAGGCSGDVGSIDAGADAGLDMHDPGPSDPGSGDDPGEADAVDQGGNDIDPGSGTDVPEVSCECATNDDCLGRFEDLGQCERAFCDPESCECSRGPAGDGAPCDDGLACTVGDECLAGQCEPGANLCECETDEDCDDLQDDDLCNGSLACLAESVDGVPLKRCIADPQTIVVCRGDEEDPCMGAICVPATGECVPAPQNVGEECDDFDACTLGDVCNDEGLCEGAEARVCNDNEFCTTDSCIPDQGCVYVPNTLPCDDGDPCTINDACAVRECRGTPNPCDDGDLCTIDSCDPATGGCIHVEKTCNDCSDLCTTYGCDPNTGQFTWTPVICNDDESCTVDQCNPSTGACVFEPVGGSPSCDDGNPCTVSDACMDGRCRGAESCCDNGMDDDGNGATDCPDKGCAAAGTCHVVVTWCRLQHPPEINAVQQGESVQVFGRAYIPGVTTATVFNDQWGALVSQAGSGPVATPPGDPAWTWVDATPNPGYDGSEWGALESNNDEHVAELVVPPVSGSPYEYAFRFSGDNGATWLYCDLGRGGGRDGSEDGYSSEDAGRLHVVE